MFKGLGNDLMHDYQAKGWDCFIVSFFKTRQIDLLGATVLNPTVSPPSKSFNLIPRNAKQMIACICFPHSSQPLQPLNLVLLKIV